MIHLPIFVKFASLELRQSYGWHSDIVVTTKDMDKSPSINKNTTNCWPPLNILYLISITRMDEEYDSRVTCHNRGSMVAAHGLVPSWHQVTCNHHGDLGRWAHIKSVPGVMNGLFGIKCSGLEQQSISCWFWGQSVSICCSCWAHFEHINFDWWESYVQGSSSWSPPTDLCHVGLGFHIEDSYIDSSAQECGNSSALPMELLQSSAEASTVYIICW